MTRDPGAGGPGAGGPGAGATARVVVTGLGVKSPAGNTVAEAFTTVLAGKPLATVVPALAGGPVPIGCPLAPFEPLDYFTGRELRTLDRTAQIGLAAAIDAVADAGEPPAEGCGVYVGTGGGGFATLESLIVGHTLGREKVPVHAVPALMSSSTAARIAIRYGCRGPCLTFNTACASGATAIGEALRAIRSGTVGSAVAGGLDALLSPLVMEAFAKVGALSERLDAPAEASRPFDGERDGFVMGEGAAFLVLERADLAEARGARVYGEVSGYAANCDAHHIVAPLRDGSAAADCMRAAVADAGLAPSDIGHVNAHGTSTPHNDDAEALALRACFGGRSPGRLRDRTPPVTSTKGVTGHLVGGAGAFEAVMALLSAREGLVPPTANFTSGPATDLIDLVHGAPRRIPAAPALSNSFGFGGSNACLVLTPS
ncbi:beta-ketoacyl-[acyl-carrier-protein] synthase family protein [Planomonospora sp. ID67723]|uniref:beta-ketoacyl-[acyl-carrier-protein] synthase family protein n=1 Tax=Planomonospora sp. ID67723 TaxID=2738134 RepID=UPI0018C37B6A|nr:beta-ketoacyl-[acyl-carrier-protein] synthase family protein [Planomonospora sp. ID67723]MBG0828426.1 beta-ketoacyl-[acyl-carrier-protein] synthase family protein [Planomonospora sp. ID67723]